MKIERALGKFGTHSVHVLIPVDHRKYLKAEAGDTLVFEDMTIDGKDGLFVTKKDDTETTEAI